MLLLDRTGPIDDLWPHYSGEEPLPAQGRALVDLDRYDEAAGTPLEIGVHVPNDTAPASLEPRLGRIAMISVDFPGFADGRGFSIGRTLRRLGFAGRLRASGPVIADQFAALIACGYDEVAVPESVARRQGAARWLEERDRVTLGYQRGLGEGSILDRRRGGDD